MKKFKLISMMVISCILAFCIAMFAGCGCNGDDMTLAKPEGFSYSSGTFSWNAVDGADGYMVCVNEEDEFYITETSVSVSDAKISDGLIDKKVNTLYVKAVTRDDEGNVKASSEAAAYEFDYVNAVKKEWKVTFDLNYTGAPKAQVVSVNGGEKVIKPANPQRPGWKFEGWFRDKQCLVGVSFNASTGAGTFNVTADMTLYAKWSLDDQVTTTSVYFFSDSWEQVSVKPYKGETALFTGEGIVMAAVAGKANWFKTDIDDTATSVIFTDGKDSTDSAAFDKTKPYFKDGVWTATMPGDSTVITDTEVTIKVGNGAEQKLTANPEVEGEFMIELTLEVGDKVVIAINGETVSNYAPACGFNGTATLQGKHTFYVSAERIWVAAPAAATIKVGNGAPQALVLNTGAEMEEYMIDLDLKVGDKVEITFKGKTVSNYDPKCNFNGTATLQGKHSFYVSAEKIWVGIPETPATAAKIYFYNHGWTDNWAEVYLYCWNDKGNNAAWPGEKMTDIGDGWFVLDIDAGYTKIIFKGNDQTGDLTLTVENGVAYYDPFGITPERPNV